MARSSRVFTCALVLGVASAFGFACTKSLPEATPGAADSEADASSVATVDGEVVEPTLDARAPRDGESDAVIATGPCDDGNHKPKDLACTGLYSDFATKTLSKTVHAFEPGYVFWSDAARKSRWIELPVGAKIDVTKMNEWVFPIGTKVWKEFRVASAAGERRIETRFMTKVADQEWYRVAYQWSADETQTTQVIDGVELVPGTTDYSIPNQGACDTCHAGKDNGLLGFEAILLAAPTATGLTLAELQTQGLLASSNGNHMVAPTALAVPGTDVEKKALGYLHVNCGVSCHAGNNGDTRVRLDLVVGANNVMPSVKTTKAFTSAINQESGYRPRDENDVIIGGDENTIFYRIRPLDLVRSTVDFRMNHRNTGTHAVQMPPSATKHIDTEGVKIIQAWIAAMTPANDYPAPGPP